LQFELEVGSYNFNASVFCSWSDMLLFSEDSVAIVNCLIFG